MTNQIVRREILKIVENQIRANDPAITRSTLERLIANGHSRGHAIEMIGAVVAEEIWRILAREKEFDLERFSQLLSTLE